jgi:predicted permease
MYWKQPFQWIRSLLFRSRAESELDEELKFHLAMTQHKLAARGSAPADAHRKAAVLFGGTEAVKEQCRDVRGARWIEDLFKDCIFALRLLRRDRYYTVVATLALALGIGANTALFTIFNSVVLKPLPVPSPASLVTINRTAPRSPLTGLFSFADYLYYRNHNTVFSSLAAETPEHLRLAASSSTASPVTTAEPLVGLFITSNYLATFGVHPVLGHNISPEDDARTAGPYPALLSENYWQRRFAGDPGILGQSFVVSGVTVQIIGITPRDFMGTRPEVPDIWITSSAFGDPGRRALDRNTLSCALTGRLKPGITLEQARAELAVLATSLKNDYPAQARQWNVLVSPATRFANAHFAFVRLYAVLQIAMALVLLIACTNVAGLLLSRAETRQREIAVRLSLGASRARLVRQLLTEGTLLAAAAGVFAYVFALYALGAISRQISASLAADGGTMVIDLTPDPRAFAYVLILSLVAGISFALMPALQSTKVDVSSALKQEGFGVRRKGRLRGSLIAAQISVCLALLIGAGLLVQQSVRVLAVDPGFETKSVISLQISSPQELGYTPGRITELQSRLEQRLHAFPGLVGVTFVSRTPLSGNVTTTRVARADAPSTADAQQYPYTYVSADFFKTMGIPLRRGREFTAMELATDAPVAVVSDALAQRLWPSEDAIGKHLAVGSASETHFYGGRAPLSSSMEVIAVASDIYSRDLVLPDRGALYLPKRPEEWNAIALVRVHGDVNAAAAALVNDVHATEPNLAVNAETLSHMIATGEAAAAFHVSSIVFLAIGLLGFELAAIGVYSMVAYTVTQQTREVGIRIALGAQRGHLLRVLLVASSRWIAAGLVAGIAIGFVMMRVLGAQIPQLFGGPANPWVVLAVSLATGALAMIAAYFPARRATLLDPATVLRWE